MEFNEGDIGLAGAAGGDLWSKGTTLRELGGAFTSFFLFRDLLGKDYPKGLIFLERLLTTNYREGFVRKTVMVQFFFLLGGGVPFDDL